MRFRVSAVVSVEHAIYVRVVWEFGFLTSLSFIAVKIMAFLLSLTPKRHAHVEIARSIPAVPQALDKLRAFLPRNHGAGSSN